jgi:HAD superfamily hydrolase (TIGR01509 family)
VTDEPDCLIFDFGGVIVETANAAEIRASLGADLPRFEPDSRALYVWNAFELGTLTPEEFAAEFLAEFPIGLTPQAFLREFASWNRRIFPGAAELLNELRPRYRLAAMTNTNPLHWRRLSGEFAVHDLFERVFASHLLALRKPDPAIYARALDELDVEPHRVTFFDDVAANVEAARGAGMSAYQVDGIPDLRARLRDLGYL